MRKLTQKTINDIMAYLECHYYNVECPDYGSDSNGKTCEYKNMPTLVTLDISSINAGDRVIGEVEYNCKECGKTYHHDLWRD